MLKHKKIPTLVFFLIFGLSIITGALSADVKAQSSRPLCTNGEFASDSQGCATQYPSPAVGYDNQPVRSVDSATRDRCNNFPNALARVACIMDPSINDGVAPNAPPGSNPEATELNADCETLDDCGIVRYLRLFINVLSGVVGVVIVIMIVIGGIQYSAARDNAQGTAAARERIVNAILALVVYLGMTAFLQWVVPGGVFSG